MLRSSSIYPTIAAALLALFTACVDAADEPAVPFPTPPGALDIKQAIWNDGNARQTSFVIKADYPASPAWDHYSKVVREPWVPCVGIDEGAWENFLDGTKKPTVSVHQQTHSWVDPNGHRTLTLGIRYTSNRDFGLWPDNNEQHVFLVEYLGVETEQWKTLLKLTCGADVTKRPSQ